MATFKIAKMEKLIDEIKDIANRKTYPFADDEDRLGLIIDYIMDFEREGGK